MQTDLTYLTTGFFTVFFPESKEGETAYKEMIEQNSSPKILTRDLKNVLHQLKQAGYIVKKAKKPTQTIEEILNELNELILNNKIMNTENKPIALISTFTQTVKFYNPDGSRQIEHPDGFYNSKDLDFYKKNYIVRFSN